MTVPSQSESDIQQQPTAATQLSIPCAVNPNFRRQYSSTFSTIEWGSNAGSLAGSHKEKPERDASAGSITRTTQSQSSWGQFVSRSPSSSTLDTSATPPFRGEIALNYGNGELVILQVPTKGEAAAKSKAKAAPIRTKTKAKIIDTSYLKLKEEYRQTSERPQRRSTADSSLTQSLEQGSARGSFMSVELPAPQNESTNPTTLPQQQLGTAVHGKSDIEQYMAEHDQDDNSESAGSTHFLKIVQEAEKRSAANRFRFPLWNSNLDPSELYEPRKQRKLRRLLVSFNSGNDNGDEEEGGKENRKTSVQKNMKECLARCQVIVFVSSIVVGIAACIVLVLALGDDSLLHGDKRNEPPSVEQSPYYSTQQQDMLLLAEQITFACGGDSPANCQHLCHNHMCCVEEEDEYSCASDAMKECAVYAGCVALIDDSFA